MFDNNAAFLPDAVQLNSEECTFKINIIILLYIIFSFGGVADVEWIINFIRRNARWRLFQLKSIIEAKLANNNVIELFFLSFPVMDIVFTKVSMYGNIINNYNDTLVNWNIERSNRNVDYTVLLYGIEIMLGDFGF